MRAKPVAKFTTCAFKLEFGIEKAVLKAEVDIVGDGRADPGDALPGEAPIAAGKTKVRKSDPAGTGAAQVSPHLNSCNACTTSYEAAQTVVIAEVQQKVDHP